MSTNSTFRILLSLAIIIGFFLPWFQHSGSGWDIVRYNAGPENTTETVIRYSFLLIPFFALIVLIRSVSKQSSNFLLRVLPFLVIGILSALFIVGVIDQNGKESLNGFFSILGIGFYLTVIASFLLIFV